MRKALALKAQPRQQVSAVNSFPAPVGGWNARDALASMKPVDAVALDNFFPRTSYVEGRGGYTSHATGMGASAKTLAVHNATNGTSKMFAMTAAAVYDVTSAGAVGASVASRTNGKHIWVNFGDGTNQWLIAVNGVNEPLYYDGTTWTAVTAVSSPALTGLTTTSISYVFAFKGRLIFLEKDSLSFWYLAAGAAGGALTEFDLSGEAPAGGYLIAGANWTQDAGDGIDDYCVFVTSEGEVLVYRGTNPSSASTWAKIGTYRIGEPLGNRCLTRYGGDLIVLTQNGAFPLSAALPTASVDSKMALSFKIENAFNTAARSYGSVFGWKAVVFPKHSALIVNVPQTEDGTHEQYVMNTITKAWCRFTGWNSEDFAILNGELYFCNGTTVYKAWTGTVDGSNDIVLYGKTSFQAFGNTTAYKHFRLFRPVLAVNGTLAFLTDIDVDFNDTTIEGTATYSVTAGAQWDVDQWDVDSWASGLQVVKEWTSPDEWGGYWASGKVKIATDSLVVQWISWDMVWEAGGVL